MIETELIRAALQKNSFLGNLSVVDANLNLSLICAGVEVVT